MEVIIKARGTGKTKEMIEHAAENDYTIVCLNQKMKRYTIQMSKEMGLKIPDPVTVDELRYLDISTKGKRQKFAVDDADVILQELLRTRIYEISISSDM